MFEAILDFVERRRQVENGLPVLDGDDPTSPERSTVADPLDLVQDRNGRIARSQEVGVERVSSAGFDRPVGSDEGLAGDLSTEDPLAALVGTLATEDVALDRFEVEQANEVVDHGLRHVAILASPDHDEAAPTGTLAV